MIPAIAEGCTNPERAWLYAHTEALLFPSEKEGFGLPAIEAMQFGRPVFIADRASLPEICDGLAYVWKSYAPADMVEVVREGLNHFAAHPERAEAERLHAARFSYAAHVAAYFRLYAELLRRG